MKQSLHISMNFAYVHKMTTLLPLPNVESMSVTNCDESNSALEFEPIDIVSDSDIFGIESFDDVSNAPSVLFGSNGTSFSI